MERKFTLSCCSTVDLPYSYMQSRDIPVLFYTYVVDGKEYVDDMGRDPEALPRFYRFLEAGKLPYLDFFEAQLEKGDLLHIAFTSGQSGSVHNAVAAAKLLQEKYPDKKLVVIDSLCSPPATACWWMRRRTCGTAAPRWRRRLGGCWQTATRSTTSSSPPT